MLLSLLPKNSTRFERSLEQALKPDLTFPNRNLWNPEKLETDLLYTLAIALQVDGWDEGWSREAKVKTLKDAYYVHRTRGTPASIKRVLKNAGYGDAELEEEPSSSESWFQYHVRLARPVTNSQAVNVLMMLNSTAPLHCELVGLHYDEVSFIYDGELSHDGEYSYGTAVRRKVING